MKINTFKMLPLAKSLLEHLQTGIDKGMVYIDHTGVVIDEQNVRNHITAQLVAEMKEWKPLYQNKELLDEDTRLAGARFLAGISMSLLRDKK
jgi:hypothetical protein